MKKSGVLNAALAQLIATMGHTDALVIGDAGLPVPPGVPCIDLAVCAGLPGMLAVVDAVASELAVERLVVASELLDRDTDVPVRLAAAFPHAARSDVDHEQFKRLSASARVVVRTGECSPYHNVILYSGVTF